MRVEHRLLEHTVAVTPIRVQSRRHRRQRGEHERVTELMQRADTARVCTRCCCVVMRGLSVCWRAHTRTAVMKAQCRVLITSICRPAMSELFALLCWLSCSAQSPHCVVLCCTEAPQMPACFSVSPPSASTLGGKPATSSNDADCADVADCAAAGACSAATCA